MRYASWLALAAALMPGCRQVFGIDPPRLAGDAAADSADGPVGPPADASYCYGPSTFLMCFDTPPTGSLDLTTTIDTGKLMTCAATLPASWTAAGQPDVCLLAYNDITIATGIRAKGTRPLVLLAAATINVSATLDASSQNSNNPGPGASSPPCSVSINGYNNPNAQEPGGGGAGGTLAGAGANGGGNPPGIGVACAASIEHTPLRGGGDGGLGGAQPDYNLNSKPGLGGGAVYLVAGTSITIGASGLINVSGGGGNGGVDVTGGGGGGAGGMIALYAPTIDAIGTLMSNGGGGGGGEGAGSNPSTASPTLGGMGGSFNGSPVGGTGCGRGAQPTAGANGSGASGFGASAGGGGCGFILSSDTQLSSATVSPGLTPF